MVLSSFRACALLILFDKSDNSARHACSGVTEFLGKASYISSVRSLADCNRVSHDTDEEKEEEDLPLLSLLLLLVPLLLLLPSLSPLLLQYNRSSISGHSSFFFDDDDDADVDD